MAELDAIIAILYKFSKAEIKYILSQYDLIDTDDDFEYHSKKTAINILKFYDYYNEKLLK